MLQAFLLIALILFGALLLMLDGEQAQTVNGMFSFFALIVSIYGFFVVIPSGFRAMERDGGVQRAVL